MRSRDTTVEAYEMQCAALRSMSSAARLGAVFDLCDDVRQVALDGPRSRSPDATEHELVVLLIDQWYGPEVADDVRHLLGPQG